MVKFYEQFGWRREDIQTGELGLEIETESLQHYAIPEETHMVPFWKWHQDGSLRNVGIEYVFRRPYNFKSEEYNTALEVFDGLTKLVKFENSVYSSVHVHFNMYEREPIHILNFIGLYFLFEEVLTSYCGADRNGNLFCLKTSNAEYTSLSANKLAKLGATDGFGTAIRTLHQSSLKYGALNLSSLGQLGSLEIRTHPGTVDVKLIDLWISILYKVYQACTRYESPTHVLNAFKSTRPVYFLESVFEELTSKLPVHLFETTLKNPLWYLSSLAVSVDDWSGYGEKKIKTRAPRVKYPSVAGQEIGLITIDESPLTWTAADVQMVNQQMNHYFTTAGGTVITSPLEDE